MLGKSVGWVVKHGLREIPLYIKSWRYVVEVFDLQQSEEMLFMLQLARCDRWVSFIVWMARKEFFPQERLTGERGGEGAAVS